MDTRMIIEIVLTIVLVSAFVINIVVHSKKPTVGKLILEQFEPNEKPIMYLDISPEELDKLHKRIVVCFVVENKPYQFATKTTSNMENKL
jgi:hypothetical protein